MSSKRLMVWKDQAKLDAAAKAGEPNFAEMNRAFVDILRSDPPVAKVITKAIDPLREEKRAQLRITLGYAR